MKQSNRETVVVTGGFARIGLLARCVGRLEAAANEVRSAGGVALPTHAFNQLLKGCGVVQILILCVWISSAPRRSISAIRFTVLDRARL
jgi:hypothetical protein